MDSRKTPPTKTTPSGLDGKRNLPGFANTFRWKVKKQSVFFHTAVRRNKYGLAPKGAIFAERTQIAA